MPVEQSSARSSLLKKERDYLQQHRNATESKLKTLGVSQEVYVGLALGNMIDIRPSFPTATKRAEPKDAF